MQPSSKKSLGHKASQVQRLQDLAGRAEYLWSLVIDRLRISEREISRAIDVWGAADLPVAAAKDGHGRLVRVVVLARRQGRFAGRLRSRLRV